MVLYQYVKYLQFYQIYTKEEFMIDPRKQKPCRKAGRRMNGERHCPPHTAEQVWKLRGSVKIEYNSAMGAELLWHF